MSKVLEAVRRLFRGRSPGGDTGGQARVERCRSTDVGGGVATATRADSPPDDRVLQSADQRIREGMARQLDALDAVIADPTKSMVPLKDLAPGMLGWEDHLGSAGKKGDAQL